jgi:hypothetical protein
MDRDKISNLYREPSKDASYQVMVHLAKRFRPDPLANMAATLFLFGRFKKIFSSETARPN